ncbi:porin [Xanthomonas prunicola]|uniref:Porin n=1 Tax=Xanthomonas prunicola TaxID=2053930 RepID=A0A9Q9MNK4_9XANT|nr:porin [Xanthomonas prunicola]USI99278.1 porin [Xanthomonas prunicola]UXA47699.1 porin [Xanthomonas prunicola]UXA54448.1 porin [Xanthomonas prunicola]UXA62133.1 porin [Xanthomonas prunicola]UXA64332.1 porin [Xanthomonas prunicola]
MRLNLLVLAVAAAIVPAAANAATSIENWPTKYTFGDGTELGLTGNYAYDDNNFSGDDRLEDRTDFRRKEFGATIKKKGVYDAMVYYDFESKLWLDVFYRFETKALFGQDYGRVRLGYIKVPVGLEAVQSSRAGSFMELGLPSQAVFEGRRTGVEWTLERQQYLLQAGAYGGKDLQGDNPGTTQAVHAVWTPFKSEGDVLHLGFAGAIENPRGYTDGRGVSFSPRVRLRARPEAGLTDVRLIDTGTILDVDHVIRTGLEGVWIHGPFSLQSEALRAEVARNANQPHFIAQGQYIYGTWSLTGESRSYAGGVPGNIKPTHDYGAVELTARYSHLNLEDNNVHGGRQHDTTIGANWYLTSHFKFQANYSWVDSSRNGVHETPHVMELRAQVQF